jgi:hypothetical protein
MQTCAKCGMTENLVGPKRLTASSVLEERTSAMLMLGMHHLAVKTSSSVDPHVSAGTPNDAAYFATSKST